MQNTTPTGRQLVWDLPTRVFHWALAISFAGGRARDYEGHNPAGSWAIYGLLALASATAVTGWLHYNAGGGERFEEVHELLANAWLVMVVIHVAGVIVGSVAHRRNLVAAMITGRRAGAGTNRAGPTPAKAAETNMRTRTTTEPCACC